MLISRHMHGIYMYMVPHTSKQPIENRNKIRGLK